jgi:putative ATP-dependent endonuclease of OLD family
MRLASFDIQGHAVLADMTVEVRDHLVIVGANDVGKTSILRLLNLLLGAPVQQLYQSLTPADIRAGAESLVVSARLEGFTEEEASQFPFAMTIEDGQPDHLIVRLEVRPAEDDPESVLPERYFPDAGTRRPPSRDQLLEIGWRYLPADRSSSVGFMDGRNSPFRTMLDSADIGEALTDLGGLLEQFNDKLEATPALQELRRSISAHLSRSVPRKYTEESLTIRTAADPRDEPLQDVTIFLKDGEQVKGLAEQSDGMRQLMALTFFDLAQATANIVAVDEPEIHLHASSQRTVAALFAESPQQRLVVTHSPYIVQRFEPKHVLVIDPDRLGKQIPPTSFSAVEKEMVQWWSPQLLEGLTARRILFVEGLADRIVIEAAAHAMGHSLDRIGVSVFALDGADKFSHVLKIVGRNGFQLPICGLCDEDRENTWAGNLGLPPRGLATAGFFVARSDLEHEYVRALGAQTVIRALVDARVARESGIVQSTAAPDIASVTDEQLGTFLSSVDSRKVPAARAISPLLTPAAIANSPSLYGLLTYIQSAN